ncbi:peptidoglycan-binding domain-containing protein [Bartonella sp. LJL80]
MAVMSGLGRLLQWLVIWTYRHARKNPLLAAGFFLFLIGFGFVTFNALFYQTTSHHGVFIETRPALTSQIENRSLQAPQHTALPTSQSNAHNQADDTASATQSGFEALANNLLDAQKKLSAMGLYDGPLDGLDGPKTRNAIALWKQKGSAAPSDQQKDETGKKADDIASLIAGETPSASVDKMTTRALPAEKTPPTNDATSTPFASVPMTDDNFKPDTADIMRVQAGLRAFGNDRVEVTGKEDDETSDALKQFQKMFSLNVTGRINREVLNKMRDIGLLG